jgi:hypothetical protein
MARVKYHDEFHEIDGRVRIERGQSMKSEVATPEFLDKDVFHAGVGTPVKIDGKWHSPRHYEAGKIDAKGKIVEHGKPFHFIDWHPVNGKVFFVYLLEDDATWNQYTRNATGDLVLDTEHPQHNKRWIEKGEYKTWDEAETFAATL